MRQQVTKAAILSRTEYGEADRILTLLTPDFGKLTLLAKGVRRVKSKLAGGIELFSLSEITFIQGRGSMGTLVSTRLIKHYATIVTDIERTMLGYDLIKQLNKLTEDQPEEAYFTLLQDAFIALDDKTISLPVIKLWFPVQYLRIGGRAPNLQTDSTGGKLSIDQRYDFSFDHMAFASNPERGRYTADHIKFLRLAFAGHPAKVLSQVQGSDGLVAACAPLVHTMAQTL
jgi:DNA repair protein RecO